MSIIYWLFGRKKQQPAVRRDGAGIQGVREVASSPPNDEVRSAAEEMQSHLRSGPQRELDRRHSQELQRISKGLHKVVAANEGGYIFGNLRNAFNLIECTARALENESRVDQITGLSIHDIANAWGCIREQTWGYASFPTDLLLSVRLVSERDDVLTLFADLERLLRKLEDSPQKIATSLPKHSRVNERDARALTPAKTPQHSKPSTRPVKLPTIGTEFLPKAFSPIEPVGRERLDPAVRALNSGDSAAAEEALKQSIVDGLTSTQESYANCQLGILALGNGQLMQGVDYLLRSLGADSVSATAAWEAAVRLQTIYTEAGRFTEADALSAVTVAANTRNLELAPEAREKIQSLVRGQCQSSPSIRAQADVPNRVTAPKTSRLSVSPRNDTEMLKSLVQLCDAYAANDQAAIARLEPTARAIAEDLNRRGGIEAMRAIWNRLGGRRGARTLEMHWDGIGDWRG